MVGRAVEKKQCAAFRLAQPRGVVEDRVEHRLDVRGEPADDAQDLAGGRLLLERLRKLSVARLHELCRGLLLLHGLGQCLPEDFDLGLQICVRPGGSAGVFDGAAAFLAERRPPAILVLAPGTVAYRASRVRIVSACQGLRLTAPGPPPKLGVPAVPWGTGAPTLPRPGLER